MEQIFISSAFVVSDIISSFVTQHRREGGRVVDSAHSAAVVVGRDRASGVIACFFCVSIRIAYF